jgi:hypothetical protein
MIRVRLADHHDRNVLAKFLRFSDIGVHEEGVDTLLIDFSNFELDEQAQLRVVNRMLEAWQQTREERIHAEVESDNPQHP